MSTMENRAIITVVVNIFIYIIFTITSTLFHSGVIGDPCIWPENRQAPGPNPAHVGVITCGVMGIAFSSWILIVLYKGILHIRHDHERDVVAGCTAFYSSPLFVMQLSAYLGRPYGSQGPSCSQMSDDYFSVLLFVMNVLSVLSFALFMFLGVKQNEIEIREELEKNTGINAPLINQKEVQEKL